MASSCRRLRPPWRRRRVPAGAPTPPASADPLAPWGPHPAATTRWPLCSLGRSRPFRPERPVDNGRQGGAMETSSHGKGGFRMDESKWERYGAGAGVVFVVLLVLSGFIAPT